MGQQRCHIMSKKLSGREVVGTEPGGGDTWLCSTILRGGGRAMEVGLIRTK